MIDNPTPAIGAAASAPPLGIVGLDVPFELVRAAGFRPIRLQGDPDKPSPTADRLLGRRIDPQIRSLAETLLGHEPVGLRGILISHDNHAQLRLFAVLRALRTSGSSRVPPLHFCDFVHSSETACSRYNRARMIELRALLASWAGRAVGEASLRAEVSAANRQRAELRGVSALRRATPPQRSGTHFLALLHAAWRQDPVVTPSAGWPPHSEARSGQPAPRRVFLTGSNHDNTRIYEAIEAAGCVIVGEDHDWGDPGIEFDLNEHDDPLDALLDRLLLAPPVSAKSSIARRTAYTVAAAVKANANAVIAFIRDGDAGPRWDVADQRRALQALDIPLLLIDDQPYLAGSDARITDTITSFLDPQAP